MLSEPIQLELRNAMASLDNAWAVFEQKYITELIVIEKKPRQLLIDAVQSEQRLQSQEQAAGNDQSHVVTSHAQGLPLVSKCPRTGHADATLVREITKQRSDSALPWYQSWSGHQHALEFETIWANPHKVLFTNSIISTHFSCGRTVQSTIDALASGSIAPKDIPTIRIVRRNGKLLTLDHRRLYAFQKALPAHAEVPMKLLLCDYALTQGVPPSIRGRSSVRIEKVGRKTVT